MNPKLKPVLMVVAILVLGVAAWGMNFYLKNLTGAGPAFKEPKEDITKVINTTGMPLKLDKDFSIEVFAKELPGARVIKQDSLGNFWVSQTSEGTVSLLEVGEDGKVRNQYSVLQNLNRPHGLAFDPQNEFDLYVAEETKISRVRVYSDAPIEKVVDLPAGGRHFTRTLGFGPDNRLYVSIGSTCDVCEEKNEMHGTIYSMNKDGSDFKEFANGLRNSVFFDWSYVDGRMWATEMGRDQLGDNLPPDEINIIEEGKNYGWPICYGKNVHDTNFDKKTYIRNPCMEPFETPSHIDLPAHSAPLGLGFIPEEGWPEEYWYNLLVAYHGSWNRSEPTGYKIARIVLDDEGNYQRTEDFITGWLDEGSSLGRPVDLLIQPGGVMYATDDKAGVVYKISYGLKDTSSEHNAEAKKDLIAVKGLADGATISSPLIVEGSARGNWFFEASFPAKLLDGNGKEIAMGIATAQGEWMTTDFVDFKATLNFTKPTTSTGTLILMKDNPSGLPQNDDHLEIQVKF